MPPTLLPTPEGLLRHGEPHQLISGALHYFRVHPDLWRDRLRRLVAMGCTAVETYVAWNLHEPVRGTFRTDGIADLGRFLRIAQEEGLDAIVRPGPYICAEWDNGGLPGWMLADPTLALRTSDPRFLQPVDAYFDRLIPLIADHQVSRGGNVVMVQVENEYGSYGDDIAYLEHLRDGLVHRGIDELLVTSDGPLHACLAGGSVPGALPTVNYGSRTLEVLEMARKELPAQPLMCMEFWIGWFDHWGTKHHTRDAVSVGEELELMLNHGMSVNFYMAHGGTNFGLTAGANDDTGYGCTTTSYDYDAPIAENGELTEKFHVIREVIGRYRDLPPLQDHLAQLGITAHPEHLPAGGITVEGIRPLRETELFTRPAQRWPKPPSFEQAGLERGLMRLSREVELWSDLRDGERHIPPLSLLGLRDRAWCYIDGVYRGVLERDDGPAKLPLAPLAEELLGADTLRTVRVDLLIEGLGRTNYGTRLGDRKGILQGVWFSPHGLTGWEVDLYPLEDMGDELAALVPGTDPTGPVGPGDAHDLARSLPVLVSASFTADAPADTFLDLSDAGHGMAWVNGFAVGRFWNRGPQQTLYVPSPVVRAGRNEVLLLDLEAIPTRLALAEHHIVHTPIRAED